MRKVILGMMVSGAVLFTACDDATSKISDSANDAATTTNEVEAQTGTASFAFTEENWEFGDITDGTVAKHTFTFTNTGDAPLIIYNAQGSCGCTVPQWPREAIAPGETGEIKVSFNSSGRKGMNNKTVTLTTNTVPNKKVLKITANVTAKADAGANKNGAEADKKG